MLSRYFAEDLSFLYKPGDEEFVQGIVFVPSLKNYFRFILMLMLTKFGEICCLNALTIPYTLTDKV